MGRFQNALHRLAAGLILAASAAASLAGPVLDGVRARGVLRVCIWPDYYGITYRHPHSGVLSGLDIEMAQELARDLGVRLEFVDSSFARLKDDVLGDRCDVAMFAVGVLPEREAHLRFTRPYLRSGIFAIALRGSRVVTQWSDIDRPGVLVGVQKGTFMQTVMAASLKEARLVVIEPPQTREGELNAGRIDVFMTDYPYSRRLLDQVDWARLIEPSAPVSPLPYAYAMKPGDNEWFTLVDRFVMKAQRIGRLDSIARRHGLQAIVVR